MSQLGDQIAKVETDLAAVKGDIVSLANGITSLNTQIQDLQKQLAGGIITAADQAALAQLVTDADALKAQADTAAAALQPPPAPLPAA